MKCNHMFGLPVHRVAPNPSRPLMISSTWVLHGAQRADQETAAGSDGPGATLELNWIPFHFFRQPVSALPSLFGPLNLGFVVMQAVAKRGVVGSRKAAMKGTFATIDQESHDKRCRRCWDSMKAD